MTIRIWINGSGTSRIQAMDMLRNNPDNVPVEMIATRKEYNPSLDFADISSQEEPGNDVSDEEYGTWAIEFVRTHGITIAMPTTRMAALDNVSDELRHLGCITMSPPAHIDRLLDSKSATYRELAELGFEVPKHFVVDSSVAFRDAVWAIQDMGHTACVKPDTGFGASGFRIITKETSLIREVQDMDHILAYPKPAMWMEEYAQVLVRATKLGQKIRPLIVMPYMDGPEISVDTVATHTGEPIVSVPRTKTRWYREFHAPDEAVATAQGITRSLALPYLTNVQFRHLDGRPVLLEINPRPSAGTFHSQYTGVNLYWEAVKVALGLDGAVPVPKLGGKVLIMHLAIPMPD
ncbi:ATP-grasp domain-containing protein [Rhodococcus qingshengii]|uniref:ATP-grasp domain-containing protein n=1 Tax=Rhodococcus qingshengii TaxID=334542 RepID=UPI0035D8EAAA